MPSIYGLMTFNFFSYMGAMIIFTDFSTTCNGMNLVHIIDEIFMYDSYLSALTHILSPLFED